MYGGLYSVIAQVNMILENKDRMDCIADPVARAVVLGEAYALRAYCHFDVLRLFGQLPQHPGRTVSLPYAERVSAVELPGYYDYAAFCKKIETDLAAAEEALQGVDPVIEQGMVYSGNNDSHLDYRGLYLNYYAIKALQARFWLYTGDSGKAYTAAKIVYDAKPVTLSGREDLGRYNACPSECLFMLSVNELLDYSINVLHGGADINLNDGHLSITNDMRNALYPSVHYNGNRNSSLWASNSGKFVLTKYYYNSSNTYDSEILLTKLQIIPMLRMSEIYLILLETTSDQAEADTLYEEYMRSHDISVSGIALADISAEVLNEMRREFIGEGQMFYTYKRTGATGMLWGSGVIGEDQYILPLPRTESDPDSSNSK